MAFIAANFVSIAIGAAPVGGVGRSHRIYHYVTPDALATVAASGYFNSVTSLLNQGDLILVSAATNTAEMYIISSATGAATVTTVAAS